MHGTVRCPILWSELRKLTNGGRCLKALAAMALSPLVLEEEKVSSTEQSSFFAGDSAALEIKEISMIRERPASISVKPKAAWTWSHLIRHFKGENFHWNTLVETMRA